MSPDPRCSALKSAMEKQGLDYAGLGKKIGKSEKHVEDICTGASRPTDAEFNALSEALGISNVPHTGVHSTV
ncbi:hypothetical protein CPB83DRAFT_856490 [Crepidotus variabilis]|uniref:HTH cro/C1-type domain-containing protein n=1 Tax=Crepidotus variabilis TaxID=179855 RepID=A0A9P6EDX8_9AGAR|nr:hypothetical protein CPB83DRAFT_856490 [Crepidotus variabilis]